MSRQIQKLLSFTAVGLSSLLSFIPSIVFSQPISGYSQPISSSWCTHLTARRFNVDLNNDRVIDAICRDRVTGHLWVAINRRGALIEEWVFPNSRWCTHSGASIFVADQNNDGRADLVCRDSAGWSWVDFANERNWFAGTDQAGPRPDFMITSIRRGSRGLSVRVSNLGSSGQVKGLACNTLGRFTSRIENFVLRQGESRTIELALVPVSRQITKCTVTGLGVDRSAEIFVSNNTREQLF
ncbi:FG-GAP repeat domain-containing protein [Anabaena catenula]|uniref:VCBS repeat-containing protein n=1 Tax=Anabaena catenula FACHB-362 TaxID=2692877 RepID=A0ABR8IW54_9NOST|nr:VCBS repeat-containing protein [Anabaena catenula]MBD2690291.1 VCBS repeat-containing protein [Anabaena catenula FACHB-362]